jgi:ATP-dependent DNA helicase RecG
MAKPAFPPFDPRSSRLPTTMTRAEFMAAFPAQSDRIERKAGVGQTPIAKAVTALSNTDGGVILVGVRDDGELIGRSLTEGVENAIHQAALTVHDPGRYRLRELDVDGVPLSVISVARREQGFAQTADGQVLVRRGARSVPLMGAELISFVTSRALARFDESDSGIDVAEADPDLVDALRRAYAWRVASTDRLIEHRLAVHEGGTHLTVAGALLLLARPDDRLGKAYVEVLRFPDQGVNYDRRVEFAGPAHHQVESVTTFLLAELGSDLVISGAKRYEIPKLPDRVVREAVANAVAHRSYEEVGRAIRVELRPDRVEIISPGGLPEPVTEENIRETQYARNIRVLSALRRFRLAEDAGRGVDVIQDSMAEALLDPPVFEDLGHSVSVKLPVRGPISARERVWVLEVEQRGRIEPIDRIPLIHAARGEGLTNARVRELLGLDSRDARQSLQRLRDAGFLEQVGDRGGATYYLSSAARAPAAFRMSRRDLKAHVLSLADEELPVLTNARVREATGLDRVEAFRLLDELVRAGELQRRGERRGSFYVRAR